MGDSWAKLTNHMITVDSESSLGADILPIISLIKEAAHEELAIMKHARSDTRPLLDGPFNIAMVCIEDATHPNLSPTERGTLLNKAREAFQLGFNQENCQTHRAAVHAFFNAACSFALHKHVDARSWLLEAYASIVEFATLTHQHNEPPLHGVSSSAEEMFGLGLIHWLQSLRRRRLTRRSFRATCAANTLQSICHLAQRGHINLSNRDVNKDQQMLNYLRRLLGLK